MLTRRHLLGSFAAASLSFDATCAESAKPGWPLKPLRMLVGFPAGASPDVVARSLSDTLGHALGQPLVVENKPGASGNIAADQVAKATDEHTLGVLINGNLTIARLLNPAVPFDPARDFAPISLLGTAPLVLAVSGNAVGTTPGELLQWARGLGVDKSNYGTPGNGTVGHLGMELLKSKVGLACQHVPFPGNPQVVTAMLGGLIDLSLLPPGIAMPHVRAGKLKAIAVTSPGRSPQAPELPTLRELGIADTDLEVWTALVGPASLPQPVVARLSAAVADALRAPEAQARLLAAGWHAVGSTPGALSQRMKADTALLGGIIAARGIKADS